MEKLQEAKILLTDPHTAPQHLSKLSKLEWMQLTWAGIDKAIPYILSQQNTSLMVTRFGGVFGPAMAQYVIGQIASWERDFRKLWSDHQKCDW